jgi:hypothetical protein
VSYVTKEVYVTIITQVEAECEGKVTCFLSFKSVLICPLSILDFGLCFAPLSKTKLDLEIGCGHWEL